MNETTPADPFTKSGNKCLISSSSNLIIDSGATDNMTCNPKIFSKFRSHEVPSTVTIADISSYAIEGSGIVNTSSSITLSCVLGLPSLAFDMSLWYDFCE